MSLRSCDSNPVAILHSVKKGDCFASARKDNQVAVLHQNRDLKLYNV